MVRVDLLALSSVFMGKACSLLPFRMMSTGLPRWLSGKESSCQCRSWGFDPGEGNGLSTPVFSPGKSHGQMSLEGYSPWGRKRIGHDLVTKQEQNRSKKFADLGVSQS